MSVKVQIVFHSVYGHVWKLAEAIAEGARQVPGADVKIYRVPELLGDDILAKMHATEAKKAFAHVPVADAKTLADADVILFGTGTRYGSAGASLQAFFDSTGSLWEKALIGKVGGVFASTGSQHGGQETTLTSLMTFLFHHGMVVAGVPYAAKELTNMDEITGGTPYGSTTIAGGDGSRQVSANELAIARYQGKHAAELGTKLAGR